MAAQADFVFLPLCSSRGNDLPGSATAGSGETAPRTVRALHAGITTKISSHLRFPFSTVAHLRRRERGVGGGHAREVDWRCTYLLLEDVFGK